MAPSPVFVIVVRDIPAEKQSEWLRMAEELASHTWNEPGCNSYSFIKKEADVVPAPPAGGNGAATTRFVISEIWASQAQLEAHFQTPHFKKLVRDLCILILMIALCFTRCLMPGGLLTKPSTLLGASHGRTRYDSIHHDV